MIKSLTGTCTKISNPNAGKSVPTDVILMWLYCSYRSDIARIYSRNPGSEINYALMY